MQTERASTISSGNGKRTRRGPHTRRQILDASLRLFSQKGFARTTVRDIARQAGITDAAIYYHFQSKRDLMEALVEERGFVDGLQNLEKVTADRPLMDTIAWMTRGAVNMMDENREFVRLILIEGLGGDPTALEQYRRLVTMWEDALSTILQRYKERGEIPEHLSPDLLARQIIYMNTMAFQESLLDRCHPSDALPSERRELLLAFATAALEQLVRQPSQPA